ncbi:MAG: hypothetical protein JO303_12320 [Caulobacteraceae bacterium]|nr:hypothetical protein [Caulobacteraceae bacterium]
MAHQNTRSERATAQNAAVPSPPPSDQAREQQRSVRSDPRRYAAPDYADAAVAPPAAGEVADYMDEGEALSTGGVQQGGDRRDRPARTEAARGQGAKTREANHNLFNGRTTS